MYTKLFIFQVFCEKKTNDPGEEMKQFKSKVGCSVLPLILGRKISTNQNRVSTFW